MISPDSTHTWILSDGHAGNVRQATALARALALSVDRALALDPGLGARLLAPRRFPGADHTFGPAFARDLSDPPALAIGCGRQAALATRLLRRRGSRVVQVLDPRIDPAHWDIVVAPAHDGLRGDNVVSLLGSLNPVDDAWLARARSDFAALAALPAPRTALLVGGSSAHACVDATAVQALLARLEPVLAREGGSLLLSTSRRTDPRLLPMLRDVASRWPGGFWDGAATPATLRMGPAAETTHAGQAAAQNPYPGFLAFADRIVCTADSVNMVSEACATSAPVFVFAPDAVSGRPHSFLEALRARGRIQPLDGDLQAFDVQPLRETARVARDVAHRLGLPPP